MCFVCFAACGSPPPAADVPTPATASAKAEVVPAKTAEPKASTPAPKVSIKIQVLDDPPADKAFGELKGGVGDCYLHGLKTSPKLAKDPLVEWVGMFSRDASGNVTSADIPGLGSPDAPHQELRQCIVDILKATKLPPPPKPGVEGSFFVSMKLAE